MERKSKIQIRHTALQELITSHPIEDQQTLVQLMKERYGIDTSQAIISRDLRTLGVIKRSIKNKLIYDLTTIDASKEILRLAVSNVVHNEALIIINTLPALAAFVGDYLDMHEDTDILGVLAGENTVFVTPTRIADITIVYAKICKLLYVQPPKGSYESQEKE
jgi:transcriptional regulator of arginine metabolism